MPLCGIEKKNDISLLRFASPWGMVSSMTNLNEIQRFYAKRFTIETLFSDVKGRGFNLDKTGLYEPERVSRLIMVAAMAYAFTIFLGIEAVINRKKNQLTRLADCWHDAYLSLLWDKTSAFGGAT